MFGDMLPSQRIGALGLGALVCGALGYTLVKGQRQPAPIVFQESPPIKSFTPQEAEPTQPKIVVIHAAGAVKKPGVLKLDPDARVDDAIREAGGPDEDADLEAVNLAARLVDGSQLFIPRKGKVAEAAVVADEYRGGSTSPSYTSRPTPSAPSTAKAVGPVSLNTGTLEELDTLPGVGPATAQKIIEYRQAHGGFSSIDELLSVKGIGPKKLQAMRKHLRL